MRSQARSLYPEIKPYRTGELEVPIGHTLYYEECGNPTGKPVVFLHGGPGAGAAGKSRQFFDPNVYRIIIFDQRGCGRSKPHTSLEDNTTWKLVADIEALRMHLGIKQWMVFGGSWGSTLALAYAQTCPEHVTELVLRGIFLFRKWELDWMYQEGASRLFPDAWEHFLAPIPTNERHDLLKAYYQRLTSSDDATVLKAAKAWSRWEAAISHLIPEEEEIHKSEENKFARAIARIESHFFVNKGFFKREEQLLEDVWKIRHIPAVIVHGRYDAICPIHTAWELHTAWPDADFRIVQDAGHSAYESGIVHELVTATDRYR